MTEPDGQRVRAEAKGREQARAWVRRVLGFPADWAWVRMTETGQMLSRGYAHGRADMRAEVVAWLRNGVGKPDVWGENKLRRLGDLADALERGENGAP